jgi:hypothetical protein
MKRGWGKIKSLGKSIDSAIPTIYLLILAYILIIGLLVISQVYTTK